MEEMRTAFKQLVLDEITEEGTVGTAGLAHGTSGKVCFPILQPVMPFDHEKLNRFQVLFAMYFATVS